eukprot:7947643-Pyramimonas_sp.AAC.1
MPLVLRGPGTTPRVLLIHPPLVWRSRLQRRRAGGSGAPRGCADAGAAPPGAGATRAAGGQCWRPRARKQRKRAVKLLPLPLSRVVCHPPR